MANTSEEIILLDGPRNAIVQLTGKVDTSDVSWVSAVTLSQFTNNDPAAGTLVGFRVNEVEFSVAEPMVVFLAWNGATPQQFASLAQSGEMDYCRQGGLLPDQTRSGYDGSINLTTGGYVPGMTVGYTVLLKLVKLYRF